MDRAPWKQLTRSDTRSKLAVSNALWNLIQLLFEGGNGHEVAVRVVDGPTGMFWEFRCAVRQKGPYKKPVFQSAGWLKYVNYKRLRVGDRIYLQAVEEGFRGTRFVLTARRLTSDGQRWVDV